MSSGEVGILALFEGVWAKEVFDVITYDLEVAICKHFGGIASQVFDEFLHGIANLIRV